MASPTQHFDVLVPGFISSKRYPSKKSRKIAALELQSVMVARFGDGKTFACQSSYGRTESCGCWDKGTSRSKARKSMFLFGYLEETISKEHTTQETFLDT